MVLFSFKVAHFSAFHAGRDKTWRASRVQQAVLVIQMRLGTPSSLCSWPHTHLEAGTLCFAESTANATKDEWIMTILLKVLGKPKSSVESWGDSFDLWQNLIKIRISHIWFPSKGERFHISFISFLCVLKQNNRIPFQVSTPSSRLSLSLAQGGPSGASGPLGSLWHPLPAAPRGPMAAGWTGSLVWERVSGQMPAASGPFLGEQGQTASLELGRGLCLSHLVSWAALVRKAVSEASTADNRVGKVLRMMQRKGPKEGQAPPLHVDGWAYPSFLKKYFSHRKTMSPPTWSKQITDSFPLLIYKNQTIV